MRLDEAALGEWLASAEGPLLRHETADGYDVPSDGSDFQRYLDGEPAPSPEVGAGWREFVAARDVRRVRVLHQPPNQFLSFEMEWQYTANVEAGEDIRILDVRALPIADGFALDEMWVAGEKVALMHYNADHTFSHADLITDPTLVYIAWKAFNAGAPFTTWWAEHPHLHRAAWLGARA